MQAVRSQGYKGTCACSLNVPGLDGIQSSLVEPGTCISTVYVNFKTCHVS